MGIENSYIKVVRSYRPPQKLLAVMSRRGPSCALEEAPWRTSLDTGCSIQTSWHTSIRRLAVRSLISSCLIDGKPPFGQERACSMENLAPQIDGMCRG